MRIAILGLGRMGSWLARELAKTNEVAGYDPVSSAAPALRPLASIDALEAFEPQLLINAASLQNTIEAFEQALPHIPAECVISDIASVKTNLKDYYRRAGRPFASVHPMFGPTFATMETLREENAIIITESCVEGREFFLSFFAHLGVRVFEFSFEEHDRMMAYSLTTPFVASLVFSACVEKGAVPGTTFARHMKIAKGLLNEDDHLISEILFNPHSVAEIEKITSRLEFLKHVIRARDKGEIGKLLAKLRQKLLE